MKGHELEIFNLGYNEYYNNSNNSDVSVIIRKHSNVPIIDGQTHLFMQGLKKAAKDEAFNTILSDDHP